MNKKNTTLYLYILIAVFTLFVGGATYAFFAGSGNFNATANLSAHAGGAYSFTSTSATDFNLNINSSQMSQSKSGNYVSSSLGTIDVTLDSPEGIFTTCTFDLLFTWNSSDKYTTPNVALPYTHSDGETYDYEFSTIIKDSENGQIEFDERDLSKVNDGTGFSGNSGTIAENLVITANNAVISKKYTIEARIYNLPVNQPNLIGKNMKASIKVDNVNCNYIGKENTEEIQYLSTHYYEDMLNESIVLSGAPLMLYHLALNGLDIPSIDAVDGVAFVDLNNIEIPEGLEIVEFKDMKGKKIKTAFYQNMIVIGGNNSVYPGPSMALAFSGLPNLSFIDMNNANTSFVNNMFGMFGLTGNESSDFILNLGNTFYTSNVTDMAGMFYNAGFNNPNFTLNLGDHFNTSKVNNMTMMFSNTGFTSNIFTLNLGSHFNTSNVTNMSNMFSYKGINSTDFTIKLGNQFNTSKVTNMSGMFFGTGIRSNNMIFDLSNGFNTSNVTDMSRMFFGVGCYGENITINLGGEFNTSKVTNMSNMFSGVGEEVANVTLNLGNNFNTSNVTNMTHMFSSLAAWSTKDFTLNLGNQFNTSKVTNMSHMFYKTGGNSANFTLNLGSQFNTSNVTNMSLMFTNTGESSSWTLNLKSFNFSKVANYESFFSNRTSSNALTILCSPTNGDFINARVSSLTGYNVICS